MPRASTEPTTKQSRSQDQHPSAGELLWRQATDRVAARSGTTRRRADERAVHIDGNQRLVLDDERKAGQMRLPRFAPARRPQMPNLQHAKVPSIDTASQPAKCPWRQVSASDQGKNVAGISHRIHCKPKKRFIFNDD